MLHPTLTAQYKTLSIKLLPSLELVGVLLFVTLLINTTTAHADFRKALDAYVARDGATMLKEVKDAVEQKNDDGLMLLLMATNMDATNSDYDEITKQSKSTLRAILPQSMWGEMQELLTVATSNSTVDTQYYLHSSTQFRSNNLSGLADEYFKKDSRFATSSSTIATIGDKAEAGDMQAQITTGFRYLGRSNFLCDQQLKDPSCQEGDDSKGYYWLKRAVITEETNTRVHYDLLASTMCDFYRETASGNQAKLKQAYLWALKGINERAASVSHSMNCLRRMYDTEVLKDIAPDLYTKEFGSKIFNALVYHAELKELPDLVVQARKEITLKDMPIFSYRSSYGLDIYSDGRVLLSYANSPKDLLMKMKSREIKAFLISIKKSGFYEWTTVRSSAGFCGDHLCRTNDLFVKVQRGGKTKQLYFSILPEYLLEGSQAQENRKRMALMRVIVNKHIPMQQKLSCGLGNSEQKKQACLMLDVKSEKIAKEER